MVVLDVATGEVLAMVEPAVLQPERASSAGNPDAHRNRAVTDVIEPGSTMKPLTVAAALEAGVITPHTRFDTNPGWMPNGRYRTTDTHNYGVLDTTGVITKSSNVGAAKIAHRLPNEHFYDFLRRFGYGEARSSGFPGEVVRRAAAAAALERHDQADDVLRLRPVGDAAADRAGLRRARQRRQADRADLREGRAQRGQAGARSGDRATKCMRMMRDRDRARRHRARRRAILGYHVAGKTGTARKASERRLLARATSSFFAGVVPVRATRASRWWW